MRNIRKLSMLLKEANNDREEDIRGYSKIFGFDAEKEIARKNREGRIRVTHERIKEYITDHEGDFDSVIDLSGKVYLFAGASWSVDLILNDNEYYEEHRASIHTDVFLSLSNGKVVAYLYSKKKPGIKIEYLGDTDDYYEVEEEDKKNITKWARSYFSDLREIKSYLEKDPDVKDKVEDCFKALNSSLGWYEPTKINMVVGR